MIKKTVLVILLMLGLMFTQPAWAVIIDFGRIWTSSGTISYAGDSAPLVGSDIVLDIVSDGTALNSYDLLGGTLNFTTGPFTGNSSVVWFFGPGGSLTVSGVVDVNGNGLNDGGDIVGPLMTGSFIGTQTVSGAGEGKATFTTFTDEKNEDLAKLFGLDADGYGYGWRGFFNLGLTASGAPPSSFSSTSVTSGNIVNRPIIPEPTSAILLGMGLLGFGGGLLRKRFKA